jgi:plastocyanin
MRRGLSTLVACLALLLAAGCGSSNSSTSRSVTSSAPAASTTSGGLKPITTPKYAAPSPSAPVRSGIVQVAYRNITINPDTLKVKVGSTIKWTNYDSVEHTVTSKGGPTRFAGTVGEGQTFEIKLTKSGVIHYLCMIHPVSMNGTIEVVK